MPWVPDSQSGVVSIYVETNKFCISLNAHTYMLLLTSGLMWYSQAVWILVAVLFYFTNRVNSSSSRVEWMGCTWMWRHKTPNHAPRSSSGPNTGTTISNGRVIRRLEPFVPRWITSAWTRNLVGPMWFAKWSHNIYHINNIDWTFMFMHNDVVDSLVCNPYQQGDPNQQWEIIGQQIRNRAYPNRVLDVLGEFVKTLW